MTAASGRPLQRLQGSCHCGAVRFAITTDFPELTTCDCSICKRKNALMVKVHERPSNCWPVPSNWPATSSTPTPPCTTSARSAASTPSTASG
jgi:hypothetical protein